MNPELPESRSGLYYITADALTARRSDLPERRLLAFAPRAEVTPAFIAYLRERYPNGNLRIEPARGLLASIYRDEYGDCSNSGISSRYRRVTVVGPEVFTACQPGTPPHEPDDDAPAVHIGETVPGHTVAYPTAESGWHMFGGTFIWSSDSRFRRGLSESPIPLHDRTERTR